MTPRLVVANGQPGSDLASHWLAQVGYFEDACLYDTRVSGVSQLLIETSACVEDAVMGGPRGPGDGLRPGGG
jgi:hypothetical protein